LEELTRFGKRVIYGSVQAELPVRLNFRLIKIPFEKGELNLG